MTDITLDLGDATALVTGECEVTMYHHALAPAVADRLASDPATLDWERRTGSMYGRTFTVPRDTCWYGPAPYAYGSIRHRPASMPDVLCPLRHALERAFPGSFFSTVLGNRYMDGADHVRWHADDEPLFGDTPVIASVSVGAPREFQLKQKDGGGRRVGVELGHGSLLVMRGLTQQRFVHRVPPTKELVSARANLTFRTMGEGRLHALDRHSS